jgi:bifunctional enzyme CysN/CysC
MSEQALDGSRSYYLKHTTRVVRANIDRVIGKLDLQTLEKRESGALDLNDIGFLRISCNQALLIDPYIENRQTGAFVLIDTLSNNTVAAGMIVQTLPDEEVGEEKRSGSMVTAAQREAVMRQRGIAVCFAGEPQAGQSEIAYALEQRLIAMGRAAWVIDVENIADGTRSPALFADLASQCQQAGLIVIFSMALPRASDRLQLRKRMGPEALMWVDEAKMGDGGDVDADRLVATIDALVKSLVARSCF